MEKVSYLGETLTRWKVGNSIFLAMPERGARLMNWRLTPGNGSVRDIIYWPDLKTLSDFHRVRGGNPVLFPFSGRTFDQNELGFWRDSSGIRRPMPMHGFARQGDFKVTRLDAHGFSAILLPSEEAKTAYPFNYEFTVIYHFAPFSFSCEFTLHNFDSRPIPWSAGHHFYFTVPWGEDITRDDYLVRIPSTKVARQNAAGQLVPSPTIKAEEQLNNGALIDTLHLGLKSNTVVIEHPKKSSQILIRNGSDVVPPHDTTFVIWTLDAKAPFFCVEPWMGPPNAPETKIGLHWVQPGQTQRFVVEVEVK